MMDILRNPGRHGHTLIEMMIVCAVFGTLVVTIYTTFGAGIDSYQEQARSVSAQNELQITLGRLEEEVFETDLDSISISTINDPLTGREETYMCFPTARDAKGAFHSQPTTVEPQWQGVIIYAPFEDGRRGRHLRRYVHYGDLNYPVGVDNVTGSELTLTNNVIINRAKDGKVAAMDLTDFDATAGAPVAVEVEKSRGDTQKRQARRHRGRTAVCTRN